MGALRDLFNWKKNPSNVWLVAGPLIVLGVLLNIARAVLLCIERHTLIPLYILLGVGILAFFAIRPLYRIHKLTKTLKNKD